MIACDFSTVYETLPATGWLSKPEALLLWETARACKGPILEVGTYHGRSTVLLASLGRLVYSVDPFDGFDDGKTGDEVQAAFNENINNRGLENVIQYRMLIEQWMQRWHRLCEFVYLDGNHTHQGTVNQIAAARHVKAKAIAIHDVNDGGEGAEIKRAVLEMLGPWRERVERLATWQLT